VIAPWVAGCSSSSAGNGTSPPQDASADTEHPSEAGDSASSIAASFLGSYACTGFQTQMCSGPGTATGTYDLTKACPMAIAPGTSASTVVIRQADGLSLVWQLTDATHAQLAGTQSPSVPLPNLSDAGAVSGAAFTGGNLLASPGMLQLQQSGTFQWTSGSDVETCQFSQRFMGGIDGG
jgi:hypothetical protein